MNKICDDICVYQIDFIDNRLVSPHPIPGILHPLLYPILHPIPTSYKYTRIRKYYRFERNLLCGMFSRS